MPRRILSISLLVVLAISLPLFAQETRDKIADQYKWNLDDIYANQEAFSAGRKMIEDKMPVIEKCHGKMGDSAQILKTCLDDIFAVNKEYRKLSSYTGMEYDENLKNLDAQKAKGEIDQLGVTVQEKTSWLTPDIQAIGKEKIGAFLQKDKGLEEYRQVLKDILRTAPHTLSPPEEAILSRVGMIAGAPYDIYSAYTSADMEFPMVKLSDGKEYRMTQAAYTKYRASNSRDDRKVVFDEFWKAYMKDQNTFGVLLNAQVQRDWFYGKTRKYDSSMAAALDAGNIPVKVYTQLVDGINANLPALYRYLELRKKMLGLPELTYYDMYPSIIKDVDMPFTYQEASDLVVEALKPLGPEYINPLKQAFTNRWVDVYPTDGKRSGAYSNGAFYDGHPYVLLNFNGDYESVSTLAHELGHSMHSYFSNKNQAFPNSDYAIFVAEVASTFNEAMLNDYMVKKETDPYKKLFLLGSNLERARQTIFRQAMFAEFEMKIHDRVEKGETLTGADLTKLYLELLKKYYGADKGVTRIDDAYGIEWAYIPHFYYDFYVYQYSTGQIAATALSEKVLSGEKGAADRYLDFLKSGSSDYPIEVLKKAGVDLTTPEPMELAMKSFNRTMDEIETILKEIDTKTKQAKKS